MVTSTDLAQMALFAGFADEDLSIIAACLVPGTYGRGELIFRQGDPGTSLYVIERGQVKIRLLSAQGQELMLAILGPGDFFGELAVLDGEPRSADAVALEPSRLLVLQRQDLRRDLEARPRIAVQLLSALSRRLRQADGVIQDAAFLNLAGRLAKVLLGLAETHGQSGHAGVLISLRLTQVELAAMVGATRESVSKWLGAFERSGLIQRRSGRITILRPDELGARID
jgi:CRP/FNR family transcriptional regulator, cyclic AMP receptor protein